MKCENDNIFIHKRDAFKAIFFQVRFFHFFKHLTICDDHCKNIILNEVFSPYLDDELNLENISFTNVTLINSI